MGEQIPVPGTEPPAAAGKEPKFTGFTLELDVMKKITLQLGRLPGRESRSRVVDYVTSYVEGSPQEVTEKAPDDLSFLP